MLRINKTIIVNLENISTTNVSALPNGIYIVNGKKVVVK